MTWGFGVATGDAIGALKFATGDADSALKFAMARDLVARGASSHTARRSARMLG